MAKIRIYELAKELDIENKALLDLCRELGISGKKSHSNALNEGESDLIRRHFKKSNQVDNDTERVVRREGEVVTEKRVSGNVIRRRKKGAEDEPQVDDGGSDTTADVSTEIGSAKDALSTSSDSDNTEISTTIDTSSEDGAVEVVAVETSTVESIDGVDSVTIDEGEETPATSLYIHGAENVGKEDSGVTESIAIPPGQPGHEMDALRRKLDIRAPKILGRIDLPTKVAPAAKTPSKSSSGSTGRDVVVGGEEEVSSSGGRASRKKGRKSGTEIIDDLDGKKKRARKQVLSKGDLLDYDGDRDSFRGRKERRSKKNTIDPLSPEAIASRAGKKPIKVDGEVTVGEMARQMGLKASQVMAELFKLGSMASVNQLIDYDTASLIAETFGFETQNIEASVEVLFDDLQLDETDAIKVSRPPIVTVMGHVDHGKTSLLDVIRKTSVNTREAGGITQHIGAYNVKLESGASVTFLDTPGHEAFTAMRGRGAKVTDIVVLVVAADDGVMPQTIEAINHAKAADVPIIVAVNKMDKEGANPEKVINQLAEHGLVPEDWGGDTLIVKVSAHTGEGVDTLLETLHLQSEVLELQAVVNRQATGTVIESKVDKGRGPVLTVLVQNGTLKRGDTFVAGSVSGKVRALTSEDGTLIESVGPSIPVEILGATSTAVAGDDFVVTLDEAQARLIADERALKARKKEFLHSSKSSGVGMPLTMERFSEAIDSADKKDLPIIVKVDVQGSLEALVGSLSNLSNEEVQVKVIHKGVGAVSENDAQLALASHALIIAFNVRPDTRALQLIENEGLKVHYSRVIYELVDAVGEALKGKMSPKFEEKQLGRVEVRETFRVPKLGVIAGSYVLDGNIPRNSSVRLLRDGKAVHEGKMASLRRFKDDVKEVQAGYECGIGIEGYADIKNGDIIEVYKIEEVRA